FYYRFDCNLDDHQLVLQLLDDRAGVLHGGFSLVLRRIRLPIGEDQHNDLPVPGEPLHLTGHSPEGHTVPVVCFGSDAPQTVAPLPPRCPVPEDGGGGWRRIGGVPKDIQLHMLHRRQGFFEEYSHLARRGNLCPAHTAALINEQDERQRSGTWLACALKD